MDRFFFLRANTPTYTVLNALNSQMQSVEGCPALGNGTAAYAFAADRQLGKTTTREHMPAEACETRLNRGIPLVRAEGIRSPLGLRGLGKDACEA